MHIGAQPVPPSLVHRWLEHFPHHQYDTDYGLTESVGPGCVHLGVENVHKVGAIGKAGYDWETKIVDELGGSSGARASVGELAVKGPGVMKCYYHDPEATAAVLKDGWLLTGDMARDDEDGFIYLVDRKKDVIITGGENIYPVQVEDFLHRIPTSRTWPSSACPTSAWARSRRPSSSSSAVTSAPKPRSWSSAWTLPRYKRPRRIIFDNVPRNATGKIDKPALRRAYHVEGLVQAETEH